MNEEGFMLLLTEHRESLDDRRMFAGLLKDLMPGMSLQTNLLVSLFDIDIHKEIEKASQMDNTFSYRFIKRLCDEYGVSRRNAEWAVSTWCSCYGESLLGKKHFLMPEEESVDQTGFTDNQESVDVSFDITSNDYVDDWRNVYEYEIVNGGVTILKYIAFDEEVITVPETIEGYSVIEIGEGAFDKCKAMKRIQLPNTITRIGRNAFSSCTFERIELPANLVEIGSLAFSSCMVKELTIPDGVTSIGNFAFSFCENMSKVLLPKNLKIVERGAFTKCEALRCIDIPEGVEEISGMAFAFCKNLERIRIPSSVTKIDDEQHKKGSLTTIFGVGQTGKITVFCQIGSEALKYARSNSINIDKYENYCED